jgi:hypothetical protein
MIDQFINAFAVGIGPTLAVAASAYINWRATERAAHRLIVTAAASNKKLDQVAETAEATHVIVNNQRTEMVATIESLRGQIISLQSHIDDLRK